MMKNLSFQELMTGDICNDNRFENDLTRFAQKHFVSFQETVDLAKAFREFDYDDMFSCMESSVILYQLTNRENLQWCIDSILSVINSFKKD